MTAAVADTLRRAKAFVIHVAPMLPLVAAALIALVVAFRWEIQGRRQSITHAFLCGEQVELTWAAQQQRNPAIQQDRIPPLTEDCETVKSIAATEDAKP